MEERWLADYETALVNMFNGAEYVAVGLVSCAAVRRIGEQSLEISWYPNVYDRFHEVTVVLPRTSFVVCVECPNYDEKPHIFVTSTWLNNLYLRPYSAFALIDAIGVKDAIAKGQLTADRLRLLRSRIDEIAAETKNVLFVSFADNLLLKSNWFVGSKDSGTENTYGPELLVRLIPQIATAFRDILSLEIYAAITQGVNEYVDHSTHHLSASGNHISLNSLGQPFAQLLAIDEAARKAIKSETHRPAQLYLDERFYHSLRFRFSFDKQAQPRASYKAPMSQAARSYFHLDCDTVLSNLEPINSPDQSRPT